MWIKCWLNSVFNSGTIQNPVAVLESCQGFEADADSSKAYLPGLPFDNSDIAVSLLLDQILKVDL